MKVRQAIKTAYGIFGSGALVLLATKQPALFCAIVGGTIMTMLLIVFGIWMAED